MAAAQNISTSAWLAVASAISLPNTQRAATSVSDCGPREPNSSDVAIAGSAHNRTTRAAPQNENWTRFRTNNPVETHASPSSLAPIDTMPVAITQAKYP